MKILLPLLIALLLAGSVVTGQDADPAAALVARAGAYVREYEQRFTGIVGEEHQLQRMVKVNGRTAKQRDVVADMLVVKAGERTLIFRDVFVVDGKPVRNREQRLQKLFAASSRDALQQAQAIVAEGARHDLDFPRFRNLSGLLIPLAIVKPGVSDRFRFMSAQDGVTFDEVRSPTVFRHFPRGGTPRDIPLRGRLSIDATSGALRAASLLAVGPDLDSAIDITYVDDSKLGMFVPLQMRETYRRPAKPKDDHLEIVSDYSNFRRFEVKVEEQVALPQ